MLSSHGVLIILLIVAIVLIFIGALGYHHVSGSNWVDSFYASALTMAGLSLEVKPKTNNEKIFIAVFTLISVGFYLIFIAAVLASLLEPIIRGGFKYR